MFLPCFLIIDSHILIPAVITQIFDLTVELAISIEIPTKEAKTEMKTHPVTLEITTSE